MPNKRIVKYSVDLDDPSEPKLKRISTKTTNKGAQQKIIKNKVLQVIIKRKKIKRNEIWNKFFPTKDDKKKVKNLIKKYTKYEKHDNMFGWVSATRVKYYLLDDMCVDWLSRYYETYGIFEDEETQKTKNERKDQMNDASYINLLLEGGNKFEQEVYKKLNERFRDDFVIVFDENDLDKFANERDINGSIRQKYNETIEKMTDGIPIIAQAVMINDENMTYGIADLLVRSDYLVKIFDHYDAEEDLTLNDMAPLINGDNYHYRVIDCKWTTIPLCIDGKRIRNEGLFPAYKGQLTIYNTCLERMQGYIPDRSYILGKAWKIGKSIIIDEEKELYSEYSAFDRLGVVEYSGWDKKYIENTKNAVFWVQRVMTEGREWRYLDSKPSVRELYPNMKKDINPVYTQIKNKIAEKYGEITQVWHLTKKNKEIAHSNNVWDIRDPNMSLKTLGIEPDTFRGKVINSIININKNNQNDDVILPKKITQNNENWHKNNYMDYYVDFETITYNLFVKTDNMDVLNSYFDSGVTFMIGIGFTNINTINTKKILESLCINNDRCDVHHNIQKKKNNATWEFVCFYLTDFKVENELDLYRLFFQFIVVRNHILRDILSIKYDELNPDSRIFHWTGAEITFMKTAIQRLKSEKYIDTLNKVFRTKYDSPSNVSMRKEVMDLIRIFEDSNIWVDLHDEMVKTPVVIKGCYRYKLKSFANAMYDHGLIKTKWKSGKMSNGFRAMIEAIKIYRNDSHVKAEGDFLDIIKYNEVDCKVMWEIVSYLRENHT